MSKFKYDDYLEEDPFLNPCTSCGCPDFYMDWDEGVYKCNNCDETSEPVIGMNGKKEKGKTKVRKFKEFDGE